MWVPGGIAYLAAGLAIVGSWLARDPPKKGSDPISGEKAAPAAARGNGI